ncbi:hypothetical protein Q7P36_008847 [Cladosporium allicinum]
MKVKTIGTQRHVSHKPNSVELNLQLISFTGKSFFSLSIYNNITTHALKHLSKDGPFRFMDLRSQFKKPIPKFMIRNALLSADPPKDHIRGLVRLVPMRLSIRLPLKPAGYVAPHKSLSSVVDFPALHASCPSRGHPQDCSGHGF